MTSTSTSTSTCIADDRLVEAYKALERMGKTAERGLAEARQFDGHFDDDVPLPITAILLPALTAVAVREDRDQADGKSPVAAWIEAREAASHGRWEPVIAAAQEVTVTWGKALRCMAENAQRSEVIELLAETETELNRAVEALERTATELAAYRTSMRPGVARIKAIVGDGGLDAAEKLLVDLLHYAADNEADLCKLLIQGLATWDHQTAHETGEVWYSEPDAGTAQMLAALKEDHFRRYDLEDREDAWETVEHLAKGMLSWRLRQQ